jgi:hypothetical protein
MASGKPTEFDYQGMARECMHEAEKAKDKARKKTLIGMARMFNQTANQGTGHRGTSPSGFQGTDDSQ